MMRRTFYTNVGGPANALSLNKESSQVAVAGRSVFKIYSIDDVNMTFTEAANLRVGKNVNLNFSCNDVAWNPIEENILASAATNGAVVTWNLSKQSRSKLDMVFQDHKRTVNKVCFHNTEPSYLLSGSQDGMIKLFDLKAGEAVATFPGLSESVRDVQFSPHSPYLFIAVQDNGYVQLYDIRRTDRYERRFTGHSGPVFACDWHPESSNTIATAGRDKYVKVWDIGSVKPNLQHCIHTIASVSKIKWMLDNKYYIASCSLVQDFSINVWDVHRPYIPFASFMEHNDSTTGLAWRKSTSSLVSTSKDGTLYQHSISDAYRPLEHANPVGMAINPDGDIALALGLIKSTNSIMSDTHSPSSLGAPASILSNVLPPLSSQTPFVGSSPQQSQLSGKFQQVSSPLQNRLQAPYILSRRSHDWSNRSQLSNKSQLDVYKSRNTEMNWFVRTAREYKLSDMPLAELCDHNAEVCAKLKRFQICQTWKILKLFYANISRGGTNAIGVGLPGVVASSHVANYSIADDASISSQIPASSEYSNPSRRNTLGKKNRIKNIAKSVVQSAATSGMYESTNDSLSGAITNVDGHHLGVSTDHNDADSDSSSIFAPNVENRKHTRHSHDHLDNSRHPSYSLYQGSTSNQHTFAPTVSVGPFTDAGSQVMEDSDESLNDWLPYEAFQPKHEICGRVHGLISQAADDSASSSRSSNHEDETKITTNENPPFNVLGPISDVDANARSMVSASSSAYHFKFFDIIADVVADVLNYHVEDGDVQSAVSILIVLGDRIKNIVGERIPVIVRESWYHSYIDLLSKFQLWNVMSQVIKLSPLPNINSINQTSTSIYTACGFCNRPLNGKVGWICDRCKTRPSDCSVW